MTADGYDVFRYTDDLRGDIDFENEIFYYSDTICERFKDELLDRTISVMDKIYMDCEEDYIPEYIWEEIKEELLEEDED